MGRRRKVTADCEEAEKTEAHWRGAGEDGGPKAPMWEELKRLPAPKEEEGGQPQGVSGGGGAGARM